MQIVYSTNGPRFLEIEITDKRETVPQGAIVFAVCNDGRTIENQDEDLFAAITDEEYFTLRAMVNEAERLEAGIEISAGSTARNSICRFFERLFALKSNGQKGQKSTRSNESSAVPGRLEVMPMRQY